MYKDCTTEKAAQQQRHFTQCLMEAMKVQAYRSITVKSLCELSGLSRMTFYRLFDNKDDVLYALIDEKLRGFVSFRLFPEQVSPRSSAYLQRMYTYWYEQKDLLKALCENQLSSVLMERSVAHITSQDPDTMHQIGAEDSRYEKEVLQFFLSGIMGLIIQWHLSGYQKSIPEMAEITYQLLTNPPVRIRFALDE